MRTFTIIGALAPLAGLSNALPTCRPQTNVPRQHGPAIAVDGFRCPGFYTHLQGRATSNGNATNATYTTNTTGATSATNAPNVTNITVGADIVSTISSGCVYEGASTQVTIRHEHFDIASNVTCGTLVRESARVSILHSSVSKPAYTGNKTLPGASSNAAFCVTNHSMLHFSYGATVSTGDKSTAVWVYGDEAEAHLTGLALGSSGSSATYGLVASQRGAIHASNIEYDAADAGACAFVSDGGDLTIGQSKANTRSIGSSIFCSLESGEGGDIHASDVVAVSEVSPAVWLSGRTGMVAFTDCDITGSGPAAIISAPLKAGPSPQARIRIVDSNVTATGAYSPIFLLGKSDVDIHLHNTELTTSDSGIIASTACFGPLNSALTAGDCDPFSVTITASESRPVGDIEPRWPSKFLWVLDTYSLWTGGINMPGNSTVAPQISVYIDDTSAWDVTNEGIILHYNASAPYNAYLAGKTFHLEGGGSAEPY